MKKILALAAFLVFITSCGGGTIGDAQEFEPNEPPSIIDVKAVSLNGSSTDSLKAGMKFTITVKAHDPENKKLKFQFNSDYGTFGNPVNTDDSCTIPFVTGSFVRPGLPVTVAVSVVDHKDASAATNYEIGKGRRGPTVTVRYEGSAYIQKEKNTRISFKADCEGIYQLYCDNGVDESSAGLRPASDYFLYRKDENGNFKDIIVDIAGPASSTEAKVKLSTPEFRNKVWVVFSDGINDPFAALAPVTVDNTPPQINIIDTGGGEGVGLRSPLRLEFNEEIMPSSVSDNSVEVEDGGSFFSVFNASGRCSVEGKIITFVPDGLEYYSKYKVSGRSGIKDLAGNEYVYTDSDSNTFTTVEKGTTPNPVFDKVNGGIYDSEQSLAISQDGAQIFCTSAVGSPPAEPTELNQYNSSIPIPVNTNIKAYAWKKGYKPSSTQEITVKIRTPKPNVTVTGSVQYPWQNSNVYSDNIVFTPNLNGQPLPSGESVKYYRNINAIQNEYEVITVVDPLLIPSNEVTGNYTFALKPYRMKIKLIAKSTNMEQSEPFESDEYRTRPTVLTVENKYIPENGYPISSNRTGGPQWKKIASSPTGQYLAAIETSTASDGTTGFIWTSSDYGNTWIKQTGGDLGTAGKNWSGIAISGMGSLNYWAACVKGGKIYTSQDGNQWNIKSDDKSWSDICISNNGVTMYAVTESDQFYGTYNSGSIWLNIFGSSYDWVSVAMDKDNHNAIALCDSSTSFFYTSQGGSWNPTGQIQHLNRYWQKGIISADGKLYIAMAANGSLHYNNLNLSGSEGWRYFQGVTGSNAGGVAINETGSAVYWTKDSGDIFKSTTFLTSPTNPSFSALTYSPVRPSGVFWKDICCDYTGSKVSAITTSGDIWTSSDGGDTWSHPGMRTWTGVACSSNGKYVAACESGYSGGYIHISSNGGASWTQIKKDTYGNSMQKKWKSIDMSNDGSVVVAVSDNEMWYSVNSGTSWDKSSIQPKTSSYKFTKVVCQGRAPLDKMKTVIAVLTSNSTKGSKNIFILDDPSITTGWEDLLVMFNDIALSDDGDKFAFALNGYSADYGTTCGVCVLDENLSVITRYNDSSNTICSLVTGNSDLSKVIFSKKMSGSGVKFIKFVYSGGPQWTELPEITTSHDSIAICGNLDKGLISLLNSEQVFSSIDGGSTWTNQTSAGNKGWNCIASTADGLTIFAGGIKQTGITVLK